jgi:hypothetical protein
MKIPGISGSPRKDSQSGVYKLVQTVLENTGLDYELVSLRKKTISGCIACLGCIKDNICRQPKVMAAAVEAGKLLGQRLKNDHDRMAVTRKMQEKMMAMFASAV